MWNNRKILHFFRSGTADFGEIPTFSTHGLVRLFPTFGLHISLLKPTIDKSIIPLNNFKLHHSVCIFRRYMRLYELNIDVCTSFRQMRKHVSAVQISSCYVKKTFSSLIDNVHGIASEDSVNINRGKRTKNIVS
jgi:hypothetical protein